MSPPLLYRVIVAGDEAEAETEAAIFEAVRTLVSENIDNPHCRFPRLFYDDRFSVVLTIVGWRIAKEILRDAGG